MYKVRYLDRMVGKIDHNEMKQQNLKIHIVLLVRLKVVNR